VGHILIRHMLGICATVLLGALAAATLVRVAPGFDVDVQQLDSRLNHGSVEALRAQRSTNSNILQFYAHYLDAAIHGDFGTSLTFNRPVRELIAERLPATASLVGLGLAAGWLLACSLAFSAALFRSPAYDLFSGTISSAFLCVPSAVLALLFVLWRAPAYAAIALVVFPKIFRYARNVLEQNYGLPHVVMARAKGLTPSRILLFHVLPVSAAPLVALAGLSVSIGLSAAIPIEALCGIPGLGQLAWQAALGRDLPLLVTLTMLVALLTVTANSVSDLLNGRIAMRRT
jgi:peptide/nickel transport system permease protein